MRNKIFVTRADFTFDLQRFDDPPTISGLNYNSEGYYEISNEAELLAFADSHALTRPQSLLLG